MELREAVREPVVFTNWDLLQDLGGVNPGATNQWPQPSSSSRSVPPLGDEPSELDTSFTEATTQTISPAANNVEPIRHITPQDRMEEENWYLLVVMTSIRQLSLGSVGNDLRELSAALPGGNTFQNLYGSCSLWIDKGSHLSRCHHEVAGCGVMWKTCLVNELTTAFE